MLSGKRGDLTLRLSAIALAMFCCIPSPDAAEDTSEIPSGYFLVGADGGPGATDRQHLLLGTIAKFGEGQVPVAKVKAEDPARTIFYDPTAVVFDYRGLNPGAKYAFRLSFLSDHPDGPKFPTRMVRVKANDAILAERIELPQDEILIKELTLPSNVYADGNVTLRIEKVEGHNAVASRVELWSDRDEPLTDIKLPAIFASNMVLQRERPIPIWGHAEPGQDVAVKLGDHEERTKADERGRWEARLPAMKAGGPHDVTITGKYPLVLRNVLIGDVWVCSGQSNMEMPLKQDKFFADEKSQIKKSNIRLFKVPPLWSAGPASQMIGNWTRCDEKTAAEFSAVGYYFGRELHRELDVPIGLIQVAIGGTPIENWTPGPTGHWYNGMMHPMLPFAIRGAIWYQGESNIESGVNYFKQMQDLIGGWRRVWGQGQFPVYFVQLAPWKHRDDPTLLPIIWEAQRKSLQIPNTGMAVTTDVGEGDLHPPNKKVVGQRLARWALANAFERKGVVCSGPLYKFHEIIGNKLVIHFDHVGGGLCSRNKGALDSFELADKAGKFVSADATINGDTVVLSSKSVAEPVSARFGWDQLAEPNLMNREGLPASPFRTE